MNISYFRSRVEGPELYLENVVVNHIDGLSPKDNLPFWVAGSPRIGSGMPDILFATYKPHVLALSSLKYPDFKLLAFLRAINGANLEVIMSQLRYSEKNLSMYLEDFIKIEAVKEDSGVFTIAKPWLTILPTIISIEVKVHDWRKAVMQASRNKIFSHQSYIALPKKIAERINNDEFLRQKEIGLLGIDDFGVEQISNSKSSNPQVWEYYYKLAAMLAKCMQEGDHNAIYYSNRSGSKAIP
jgi:hypothetical protein